MKARDCIKDFADWVAFLQPHLHSDINHLYTNGFRYPPILAIVPTCASPDAQGLEASNSRRDNSTGLSPYLKYIAITYEGFILLAERG
jgi:hypothetical protein